MRLIDADALIKSSCGDCTNKHCQVCLDARMIGCIEEAPTVDAAPVVHGKWEWNDDGMDWGIGCWKCSNCHNKPESNWETARNINPNTWNGSHYCPNCGAKMGGGAK